MNTKVNDFTLSPVPDNDAYHENIAVYDVLNDDFDGNWNDVLTAKLYNQKGECVGSLRDLHFIYEVESNKFKGSW